jgi:hypothetical protein
MKIICFLLFLYTCSIHGQTNEDYSLYFDRIMTIEESTAKEDFDKTLKLYKDLFNEYSFVLAKDAYNACQIAALQKSNGFGNFFHSCAKSGIEKNILLKNYHINIEYKKDSINLTTLYVKGHGYYISSIDTALRREFLLRYEYEQKNKRSNNYLQICTDNFKRIEELSKQNKFPGENLIGPDNNLSSPILPTLLHYPYAYVYLKSYLWQAVQLGKITPIAVLYLYSFNQTRTSSLYNSDIPQDTINFKTCYNLPFGKESADINEVNKQRKLKKVISVQTLNSLLDLNSKYQLDYRLGF